MMVRQKPASGSAPPVGANGNEAALDRSAPFSWEDWFRHASASQRSAALGLAQQQGVLYPHQLQASTNGVKPTSASTAETNASLAISRAFSGTAGEIPPFDAPPLACLDTDLDDLQRLAVARAIASPDVFLLNGLPGTGKSRVVAEIILQAAVRGSRVLYLSPKTTAIDVVLQRLADRPETLPLRFLDVHEKPEALLPGVRGLTLEQQQKRFVERTLTGARLKHASAETLCRSKRAQEPLWNDLRSQLERLKECDYRLKEADAQGPALPALVQREAEEGESAIAGEVAALRRAHEQTMASLDAELAACQATLSQCDQELAALAAEIARKEPAYLAKKHSRFWTFSFWTNLFHGALLQETETLYDRRTQCEDQRRQLVAQTEKVAADQAELRRQFDAARSACIAREVEGRTQILKEHLQTLQRERGELISHWRMVCNQLEIGEIEPTSSDVESAYQVWLEKKKADEQQCLFAQQWTKFVESAGNDLASRLAGFANVLAGTIGRWDTDPKFREAASAPVELVIIEDADVLSEAELLKLARLGRRAVLVGRALLDLPAAAPWPRLWQAFGGEAERWPASWRREGERLVCQLLPLTTEDRQYLHREGLADAPDIDLCILHRPRSRPCLAQVVFGPHSTFADAFAFMIREVQEFPLQPCGLTAWWSEDERRITRQFGNNSERLACWIEVEPGVRLGAASKGNHQADRIACLEFDKAAGWDRAKAHAWLQNQRRHQDHERTAFLQTGYRSCAPLAGMMQSVIRSGEWSSACSSVGQAFEFHAVPLLAQGDWPREGAGLEMDLAAGRAADRLPAGLRQGLPTRGFVNLQEAQALIRRLEAWCHEHSERTGSIGIFALYDGQVELLRRLAAQSEILRSQKRPLEVALPSRVQHREFDAVFLSLTRSHTHRATAFGDDLCELPVALSRARSRLLIFGDPGALSKRASWTGPLDHLNPHAALQEQGLIIRLAAALKAAKAESPHANGKSA